MREQHITRAFNQAGSQYVSKRYEGPVTLFRAKTINPFYAHVGPTLGWAEFIPQLEIVEVPGQSSYEGAAEATYALFGAKGARLPDALYCINDIMAMGAIDTLRYRLGIRVPEDLGVAGFDYILEGQRMPYQLTTVRQPIDEMVEETLAILHLDDPARPIERGIDRPIAGELIVGKTVGRRAKR